MTFRLLFVSTLLAFATSAAAQAPLEAAERAYAEGRLADAAEAYQQALAAAGHDEASLQRIHLNLGTVQAMLGEDSEAREHFAAALALAPETPAPSVLSPRQERLFEQTRAAVGPLALEITAPEGARADGPTRLRLVPSPQLRRLAAELRVSAGEAWRRQVPLDGVPSLVMPASAWDEGRALLRADALDSFGSVLFRARHELLAPDEGGPPPVASRDAPPSRPAPARDDGGGDDVLASPWFWLVAVLLVGGAAAGVGAAVALEERGTVLGPIMVASD